MTTSPPGTAMQSRLASFGCATTSHPSVRLRLAICSIRRFGLIYISNQGESISNQKLATCSANLVSFSVNVSTLSYRERHKLVRVSAPAYCIDSLHSSQLLAPTPTFQIWHLPQAAQAHLEQPNTVGEAQDQQLAALARGHHRARRRHR